MNSRQRGGTLLGLALGLMAGVLLSFAVVWYLNKTPLPFVDKVSKPEVKPAGDKPVALPGKPGDKPLEGASEKKFEFYEILEGKKPATPQGPVPAPAPAAAASAAGAAPPGAAPAAAEGAKLFLQAGAFQKAAEAENLKARLAMLGFEAGVQATEVAGKGTLHRVRLGPFASPSEMNRALEQLSQQGIPATVVRVKE